MEKEKVFTFKFLTQLFIRILTTGVVNIECEAKFVYEREWRWKWRRFGKVKILTWRMKFLWVKSFFHVTTALLHSKTWNMQNEKSSLDWFCGMPMNVYELIQWIIFFLVLLRVWGENFSLSNSALLTSSND